MAQHLEDIYMGPRPLTVPAPGQRFWWEPSPRRVHTTFNGETIADSTHVMLLLEVGHLPVYYFPWADVRADLLERTEHTTTCSLKGIASYWTLRVGERTAENVAWSYESPLADGPDVKGYVGFYWDMLDVWYEEDERAYAHARDPYKLIDIRQSSRHVRVEIGGVTVAETRRPKLLFETGLPVRYYFPADDVRMDLLEATDATSQCAYKGQASYWLARVGDQVARNVVWSYREPTTLAAPIAGYLCFYQERVDAIIVDGAQIERPQTPWSE